MAGALMMERVVSRLLHYKNAGGWQAGLVQRRHRDHRAVLSSSGEGERVRGGRGVAEDGLGTPLLPRAGGARQPARSSGSYSGSSLGYSRYDR